MLSSLLVLLWMSRYRCAPKISLVNEVHVGLDWRGLIGQHNPPIDVPLVVPRLLGFTFEMRQHCNEFSGGRKENPDHCCRYQAPHCHRNVVGP